MKTLFITLTALVAILTGTDATAQKMQSRTVSVGSFTGIYSSVFDVDYSVGSQKAIRIVAPANLINEVEVTVRDKRLYVKPKTQHNRFNNRFRNTDKVKITVVAPSVNSFNASAGSDINILTEINTGSKPLNLAASSGGDIKLSTGRAGTINIDASSSGDIHAVFLTGTNVNLTASSGADIDVDRLLSSSLNATASSGADIDVKAVKCKSTINANASSGADIDITGIETVNINADASSGGDITLEGKATRLNRSSSSGGDINTRKLVY